MDVCVELASALGAAPYLPSQTHAKDHIMKQVGLAIALAAMVVAPAVAQAAMDTGVARKPVEIGAYEKRLEQTIGDLATL